MGDTTSSIRHGNYWARDAGRKWVAQEAIYDEMHSGVADLLIDRLAPEAGERILDIGAGTGTVSLAVADRVRPRGHVTALDISPPMLGRAAERITEADRGDIVGVLQADAQTHEFEPGSFDAVTSRFGVMFFDDPATAFANIGTAVRSGGRLAMAVWQTIDHNEFLSLPGTVVSRHVGDAAQPAANADPFSLGDPAVVQSILDGAGWIDVDLEPDSGTMLSGGPATVDEAVDFALSRTHVASRLQDVSETTRSMVRDDLRAEFASRHDGEGVALRYAVWIVAARWP